MLSYFLHNTNHCYLKHLKRSEPSLYGWLNKQILGNLWAILQQFYFDKQSRKIFQAFQKLKILIFFVVDWSITDAKLLFEAPTQTGLKLIVLSD